MLNTDKQWLLDKKSVNFHAPASFSRFFLWENWEYWFRWRLLSTAYCTENSLTFDQLCFVQQKVLSFEYQIDLHGLMHKLLVLAWAPGSKLSLWSALLCSFVVWSLFWSFYVDCSCFNFYSLFYQFFKTTKCTE